MTREDQRYLKEVEWREEAGKPAIVESVRCGLVFQLKQARPAYQNPIRVSVCAARALNTTGPSRVTLSLQ